MKNSITTDTSFVDMMILDSPKPSFLNKIDLIIDWKKIERLLNRHYKRTFAAD